MLEKWLSGAGCGTPPKNLPREKWAVVELQEPIKTGRGRILQAGTRLLVFNADRTVTEQNLNNIHPPWYKIPLDVEGDAVHASPNKLKLL